MWLPLVSNSSSAMLQLETGLLNTPSPSSSSGDGDSSKGEVGKEVISCPQGPLRGDILAETEGKCHQKEGPG